MTQDRTLNKAYNVLATYNSSQTNKPFYWFYGLAAGLLVDHINGLLVFQFIFLLASIESAFFPQSGLQCFSRTKQSAEVIKPAIAYCKKRMLYWFIGFMDLWFI